MAPQGGFEPLTYRLGGGRSILLSYWGLFPASILYSKKRQMSTKLFSKTGKKVLTKKFICAIISKQSGESSGAYMGEWWNWQTR